MGGVPILCETARWQTNLFSAIAIGYCVNGDGRFGRHDDRLFSDEDTMIFDKLGGRKFILSLFGFVAVSIIFITVPRFESADYVLASVGILGFYFGTNVFQRNSENRYVNRCDKEEERPHNKGEEERNEG
jgi:hypothetical protein